MIRWMRALATGILVLGISASLTAAIAASASATTLLTCTGSYQINYDPGLTYTPQNVNFSATSTYSPCVGSQTVSSGESHASGGPIPSLSCLDLLSGFDAGQTTVTWNTGETTQYNWTSTSVEVGGNDVTTTVGRVVSGKYNGAHVLRVSVSSLGTLLNACSSPGGLQTETGTVSLTIAS